MLEHPRNHPLDKGEPNGDPARTDFRGFAFLVTTTSSELYRSACRLTANRDVSADLLSRAYTRAVSTLEEEMAHGRTSRMVVYGALVDQVVGYLTQEGRLNLNKDSPWSEDVTMVSPLAPNIEHALKEMSVRLDPLGPWERISWVLRALEGLSLEETAAIMNVPELLVDAAAVKAHRTLERQTTPEQLGLKVKSWRAVTSSLVPSAEARRKLLASSEPVPESPTGPLSQEELPPGLMPAFDYASERTGTTEPGLGGPTGALDVVHETEPIVALALEDARADLTEPGYVSESAPTPGLEAQALAALLPDLPFPVESEFPLRVYSRKRRGSGSRLGVSLGLAIVGVLFGALIVAALDGSLEIGSPLLALLRQEGKRASETLQRVAEDAPSAEGSIKQVPSRAESLLESPAAPVAQRLAELPAPGRATVSPRPKVSAGPPAAHRAADLAAVHRPLSSSGLTPARARVVAEEPVGNETEGSAESTAHKGGAIVIDPPASSPAERAESIDEPPESSQARVDAESTPKMKRPARALLARAASAKEQSRGPRAAAAEAREAEPQEEEDSSESTGLPERLSTDDIMEGVLAHRSDINRCSAQQDDDDPNTHGTLVLSWTILTSGQVQDVQNLTPELGGTTLAKCLIPLVVTWRFDEHHVQGDRVRFPFKF